jgi:hypothetical protein
MAKSQKSTKLDKSTAVYQSPLQSILEGYFKYARESEACAISKGLAPPPRVEPDEAIRRLAAEIREVAIEERFRKGNGGQFSLEETILALPPVPLPTSDLYRKYHHLAVDLYYKTYARDRKGPGRPPLSEEYCDRLLRMSSEKKTHLQMAKEMNLPTRTPDERRTAKEKIRQRKRIAIKRII